MQKSDMKEVATDIFTQAIRRDFLELMAREGNSIDFCTFVGQQLCANNKTIAAKFANGYWTTKDFEKIETITGGKHLRGAFKVRGK